MKKYPFILFLFFFLTSTGQTNFLCIKGVISDSATNEEIPFANVSLLDSNISVSTNLYGNYEICIPNYIKGQTYKLQYSFVGYDPKQIEIKDYMLDSLNIKLFHPQEFIFSKQKDNRVYDKNVRLNKFEHSNCDNTMSADNVKTKIVFKKMGKNGVLEISINYKESCGISIKPVTKFSKDTLFINLDDSPIKVLSMCDCCYTTKFYIDGIKKKDFVTIFEDKPLKP